MSADTKAVLEDSEPHLLSTVNDKRDEFGLEMSAGATIWQEYVKKADAYDQQLLQQWNQNLDNMLIVATLFSAVVTAFVIESIQGLGPSSQDLTNSLLLDIVQGIKNTSLNTTQTRTETDFVLSPTNVWVNGLWFTSLACSLGDAAIAMLIKQWLNAYSAGLPASPQLRARMRQHRFNALIRWKTPEIIGFLPFALSICVMMFLTGLSVWLFSLNNTIAVVSTACVGIIFIFHVASLFLPAICNSPWKTAISPLIYESLYPLRKLIRSPSFHQFLRAVLSILTSIFRVSFWTIIFEWAMAMFQQVKGIFEWLITRIPGRHHARTVLYCTVGGLLSPVIVVFWVIYWIMQGAMIVFKRPVFTRVFKRPVIVTILVKKYKYYTSRYRLVWPSYLLPLGLMIKRIWQYLTKLQDIPQWISRGKELPWKPPSEYEDEMHLIKEPTSSHRLDGQALLWGTFTSTEQLFIDQSIQALAGLSYDFAHVDILEALLPSVQQNLIACLKSEYLHFDKIELYARALWHLESNLSMWGSGPGKGSHAADLVRAHVQMIEQTLHKDSSAFIACICSCRMLNEIASLLQSLSDQTNMVGSGIHTFHIRLMVETLSQEISRRKQTDISMWTTAPSENPLETNVIPPLVKLLNLKEESPSDNEPLNTSIAVVLAVLTCAIPNMNFCAYSNEERRKKDFYYLICASLSMVLRFTEHFQCQEISEMVYNKLMVAGLGMLAHPSQDNPHYNVTVAEIFKATFSSRQPLRNDMVIALSKIDNQVYLHLQPGVIPDPARYFTDTTPMEVQIAIGICVENLHFQDHLALSLVKSLRPGQDGELVRCVMSLDIAVDVRAQAFKLLLKRAHVSQNNTCQWRIGFLTAAEAFFKSIGSLNHLELDHWMDTLSSLCKHKEDVLFQGRLMETFIRWAYQDWRGRPLMTDHLPSLNQMARSLSISVEDINDTSWFSNIPVEVHNEIQIK